MKRLIKYAILIILVVLLASTIKTFAAGGGSGIVTTSAEKVAPGEQFYLIINLSSIGYDNFNVAITNSQSLVSGEPTGSVSNLASNGTVTTFTINKAAVGLDKLGVVYTAPQNEGMVNYSVTITPIINIDVNSIQSRIEELGTAVSSAETEISNAEASLANLPEDDPSRIEVGQSIDALRQAKSEAEAERDRLQSQLNEARNSTPINANARIEVSQKAPEVDMKNMISGKTQNEIPKNDNMIDDEMMKDKDNLKDMDSMKDKMKLMEDNEKDMKDKMSTLQVSLKDASDKITSLSQGTTYQGSSNNYLSSLSVTGYELNNTFDKTTNDYFISVPENVNSINVNVTKEDSSATVTTYGNTNLVSGQNKVIINVTAQDGSVRTYRVYVTK